MDALSNYEIEVKKNFKHNFTVNLIDVAFFMFGGSFMSADTVLPIFVVHFTQNPILIGLISVFSTAGYLLPQIFTANWVERSPIKKFFPFNLGFFLERIPVILLAPSTFLLAASNPSLCLIAFFFLFGWQNFVAGALMVGWSDMIAKIIPIENRGKFFGLSNFIGKFAGILGATTVSWLLVRFPFPTGFVIAFSCACVFNLLSWLSLGLTREPGDPISKPRVSHTDYFKALPAVIRANSNFKNYLITQMMAVFGNMAAGFLLVYSLEKWHISDGQAASFNIAILLGQSVANLFLGFLADRKGHKIVLEISIALNVLSFLMALLVPNPTWFYLVFALRGMNLAGNFISGMSLPLEFSGPQNRPTFIGLASTLIGLAGIFSPLIGGTLAGIVGYPTLFSVSAVVAAIAFCMMHWLVLDPRHIPVTAVLPAVSEL